MNSWLVRFTVLPLRETVVTNDVTFTLSYSDVPQGLMLRPPVQIPPLPVEPARTAKLS